MNDFTSFLAKIEYDKLVEKCFPNPKDRTPRNIYKLIMHTLSLNPRGKRVSKKLEAGTPLTSAELSIFRKTMFRLNENSLRNPSI